jgi:hypothetical protein
MAQHSVGDFVSNHSETPVELGHAVNHPEANTKYYSAGVARTLKAPQISTSTDLPEKLSRVYVDYNAGAKPGESIITPFASTAHAIGAFINNPVNDITVTKSAALGMDTPVVNQFASTKTAPVQSEADPFQHTISALRNENSRLSSLVSALRDEKRRLAEYNSKAKLEAEKRNEAKLKDVKKRSEARLAEHMVGVPIAN